MARLSTPSPPASGGGPRPRLSAPGRAVAVAAGLALGVAAAAFGLPAAQQHLSGELTRRVRQALERASVPWSVGRVRVQLPATVQVEAVRGRLDAAVELEAPSVRLGVDVTAAARQVYSRQPVQQALRHIEARGLVIRPQEGGGDTNGADPSPAEPGAGGGGPGWLVGGGLSADAPERLRQAALWLVREGARALSAWVEEGGQLTWDLEGVWVDGSVGKQPWRSRGLLRRSPQGGVEVEGELEFAGQGTLRLAGALESGRLELHRVTLRNEQLLADASGRLTASRDDGLTADLSVRLVPAGPAGWEGAELRWQGPWPAGALPAASATLRMAPASSAAGGGWAYLAGGRASAQLSWDEGMLRLSDGRWQRGGARGRFEGTVAPVSPFTLELSFEAWGLTPGVDVPWWATYRVESLAVRGRARGPALAPAITAQVQAPPGSLGGVATGTATATLEVALAAARLRLVDLQAAVGSGSLTGAAEVLWGEAAAQTGPAGARVVLQAEGRLEGAGSREAGAVLGASLGGGLPGALAAGRPGQAPDAQGPQGELTGAFQVAAAWVAAADGAGLQGRLLALTFDGPDASLSVREQGDGHRIALELLNLGGRLLEPWVRGVRGFGWFEGTLARGRLAGKAELRELEVSGWRLGAVSAPVELAAGRLRVQGLGLRGGELEGQADLDLQLGSCLCGRADFSLRASGTGVPLALEGALALEPSATRVERLELATAGHPLAEVRGRLPSPGGDAQALDLRLAVHGFPLELARRWLPALEVDGGQLTGNLQVGGTLAEPLARGSLALEAAAVTLPSFPGRLADLRLGIAVDGRRLTVTRAEARSPQGGRVSGSGTASLASLWPLRLRPVDLTLQLHNVWLGGPLTSAVELEGIWAGTLRVQDAGGRAAAPRVEGQVGVRGGRVVLWREGLAGALLGALAGPVSGGPAAPTAAPQSAAPAGEPASAAVSDELELQVQVRTEAPVRVEVPALGGSGLLEGAVAVVGSLRQPALDGELVLHQARLRYFGREVRVERSRLIFSRGRGLLPGVDLSATTLGPSGPVQVRARGELADPRGLELSSQPPLPQDELAALLLPAVPTHAEDGDGWVGAVNEQLAAWAMAPLRDAARQALGLDEVWLVPAGPEQGWRLRVGKLFDPMPVYVRYGRTLRGGPAQQELEVQSRLSPHVSLGAGWSEQEGFRLGVGWEFQF